jgi:hypothetical protein
MNSCFKLALERKGLKGLIRLSPSTSLDIENAKVITDWSAKVKFGGHVHHEPGLL